MDWQRDSNRLVSTYYFFQDGRHTKTGLSSAGNQQLSSALEPWLRDGDKHGSASWYVDLWRFTAVTSDEDGATKRRRIQATIRSSLRDEGSYEPISMTTSVVDLLAQLEPVNVNVLGLMSSDGTGLLLTLSFIRHTPVSHCPYNVNVTVHCHKNMLWWKLH